MHESVGTGSSQSEPGRGPAMQHLIRKDDPVDIHRHPETKLQEKNIEMEIWGREGFVTKPANSGQLSFHMEPLGFLPVKEQLI